MNWRFWMRSWMMNWWSGMVNRRFRMGRRMIGMGRSMMGCFRMGRWKRRQARMMRCFSARKGFVRRFGMKSWLRWGITQTFFITFRHWIRDCFAFWIFWAVGLGVGHWFFITFRHRIRFSRCERFGSNFAFRCRHACRFFVAFRHGIRQCFDRTVWRRFAICFFIAFSSFWRFWQWFRIRPS